jgi:hypothetical protein
VVLRGVKAGTIFFDLPDKPSPSWITFDMAFAAWNSQSDGRGTYYYPETPVEAPEGSKELILYAIYAENVSNFSTIVCNDPDVAYAIWGDAVLGAMSPACGSPDQPFRGKFFGNGYKISYNQPSSYSQANSGLFGNLDGAVISDLSVELTDTYRVTGTGGILAGTAKNSSIRNVSVSGWLEGYTGSGEIIAGGVVGRLENSTISGAVSNAIFAVFNANISMVIGGIAGYMDEGSVITDSVHQAAIRLSTNAFHTLGGIAGINDGGTIQSSYTDTIVEYTSSNTNITVGGIVGDFRSGTVKDCLAFGTMINATTAGRIAGKIAPGASVENNYAKSDMLINYKAVADSEKDGEKLDIVSALKSRAFFRDTLNFNFNGV